MDMALDEIIATKPKTGRGGRGGLRGARRGSAREQVLGKAPAGPATRARAAAANATAPTGTTTVANKIIVSNLPTDVNETQIRELFSQTVGPLRDVSITYDSNGKSKGVASVVFQKATDGAKAFQQYNNRLIDGKRPMKIEMVVDPNRAQQQSTSLASRVAQPTDGNASRTRGTSTRGRGRGRGGRNANNRPPKTAADLDAEMEDYTASNTNAAAPAAAPATATA